jgi:hypothetical protein
MPLRLAALALFAALLLTPALPSADARAATTLGSPDTSLTPERYWCASVSCPGAAEVGLRQFALAGSLVEAPEKGVLVSASAYARRNRGSASPRVVVLRPAAGIGATIVASAPLPVTSPGGARTVAANLHLPVEPGDVLGLLFRSGEVDLGVRNRANPDGAVVTFGSPCAPCRQNGGTGSELLFAGTIEPDFDDDLLGDESQDPDGGGAFEDEGFDPLFDEDLGEEVFDEEAGGGDRDAKRPRRLRLVKVTPRRDGGVNLVLAVPRPGRLSAVASVAAGRKRPSASARVVIAAARTRVKKTGRVPLALSPSRQGRRLLRTRGATRARLAVTLRVPRSRDRTLTARVRLWRGAPARDLRR